MVKHRRCINFSEYKIRGGGSTKKNARNVAHRFRRRGKSARIIHDLSRDYYDVYVATRRSCKR